MSSQSDSDDGSDTDSDVDSRGSSDGHVQQNRNKDLIDPYFGEVDCSRWNVTDFLEYSSELKYHRKMLAYRKSLECIETDRTWQRQARDRARKLLDHLLKVPPPPSEIEKVNP